MSIAKTNKNNYEALSSFDELNLPEALQNAFSEMGFANPTEIQKKAIPAAMDSRDIIGIAQTGSGKTLAFLLPILLKLPKRQQGRALILTPTREMAQQIYKVFTDLSKDLKLTSVLAIGGVPGDKQTSQMNKLPQVIVATPGRLNDHLLKNKLLLQNVEFVVLDEADRMLDMGFAPQLASIFKTMRGNRQTFMFSASFNQQVETIAKSNMKTDAIMIKSENAETPVGGLKQKILFIDRSQRNDRMLDELNATKGGVIVFTANQESCEALGKHLKEFGYKVDFIHGDLTTGNRNRVVREFRAGTLRIIVSTDILARGIDIPHVDCVINFELPFQSEDFLHRIGRTARAGRSGTAITFVTASDDRRYQKIKPYIIGAEEVKVDPNFEFRYRTKQSEFKGKTFADKKEGKKTVLSEKKFAPIEKKLEKKTEKASERKFEAKKPVALEEKVSHQKEFPRVKRSGFGKKSFAKPNGKPKPKR